jgi:hypothetical protein
MRPVGLACHHRTGDLYVVGDLKNHVQRLSLDPSGSAKWIVTSIYILFDEPDKTQGSYSVASFGDTLYFTSWNSGVVVRTALDGKTERLIGQRHGSNSGIAADETAVYVTQYERNIVSKIPLQLVWQPQTHRHFDLKIRALVKTVVLASLRASLLNRLPRDILFQMLSFLDCHIVGVADNNDGGLDFSPFPSNICNPLISLAPCIPSASSLSLDWV